MPLVACQCTNCGAALEVDDSKEAAVCKFCGTPFIIEKAINVYKTVNVTTNTTDWKRLADNGMKMIQRDYFEEKDLKEIRKVLKDVAEEEFYVRFFEYVLKIDISLDNTKWLGKNVPAERVEEVSEYLFKQILKDYRKESISDIHFNIHKNYTTILPAFMPNDTTFRSVLFLTHMSDKLSGEALSNFNYLQEEAQDEIRNYKYESKETIYAIGLFVHEFRDFLGADFCDAVKNEISANTKKIEIKSIRDDLGTINYLKEMGYSVNYTYKVTNDLVIHENSFDILGRSYPMDSLLAMSDYEGVYYLVIKLDSSTATVVKLANVKDKGFVYCFESYESVSYNQTEALSKYNDSYKGYKMVSIEGFSYKSSVKDKLFKFFGSLLK